jgi:DNA helicase HerA-like ATPase
MVGEIIGHIGLDDFRSEDGVVYIYPEQGEEDALFRGQFISIEVGNQRFFGQIINEPKNYPLSGQSSSAMNEYPILHQEKIQYVPAYKVVSKVKILGEVSNGLTLKSHFTRPRPASKVRLINTDEARSLLNVSGKEVLGVIMGYEDEEKPITITINDIMGRKQLGIFGMTGTGKSNTCLRIAEIFAELGWCVIFLDYLGEYPECKYASDESKLFNEQWKNLDVTPQGNKDVNVYLPISDTREIEGAKKFTLKTKFMTQGIIISMFCRTEAQKRDFIPILKKIPQEHLHLKTISNELGIKIADLSEAKSGSLTIVKNRIDNQVEQTNRLFDNYETEFELADTKALDSFKKIGINVPQIETSDLDPDELLKEGRINIIDFKNSSSYDYAATTLVLLRRLYNLKKEHSESPNDYPKVMLMIEEAHIPFMESESNIFASSLNEIARKVFKIGRHYYLNICAISQRPSDIPESIISQINTRIIHRLKNSYDINKVITGDIKEYSTSVPTLKTGEAIIDSADFITPLTVKIAPARSKKIDPFVVKAE